MDRSGSILHPWESPQDFCDSNYQVHIAPEESSFPTHDALQTSSKIGGTVIRFIFWRHIPENISSVVPLIEGCDIIAREGVLDDNYDSLVERQQASRDIRIDNEFLSAVISGQYNPKVAKFLRKNGYPVEQIIKLGPEERSKVLEDYMGADSQLFIPFIGKLKKVVKVDTEPKHVSESNILFAEYTGTRKELMEAIAYGGAGWEEIKQLCYKTLLTNEDYIAFRDELTAIQIEKLVRENPGKTIGVLYGAAHHLLSRHVEASINGVSMQRVFATKSNQETVQSFSKISTALMNSLRAGYLDGKLFDKFVSMNIALTNTDPELIECLREMNEETFADVLTKIQELWQESINENDIKFQQKLAKRDAATGKIVFDHANINATGSIVKKLKTKLNRRSKIS
jgi:hypothetical protein